MGRCSGSKWAADLSHLRGIVAKSVNDVISKAQETEFDLGGRAGGYFCLREIDFEKLTISKMLIGKVTNGKDDKYTKLSLEKSTRLHDKYKSDSHELSSQSRNPDQGEWGGSVKGESLSNRRKFIFSFSGLPEMLDEAAMLLAAVRGYCMTMEYARELAAKSGVSGEGNTFFLENQWD